MYLCVRSICTKSGQWDVMYLCVRGYMTSHSPALVPLTHKYMTSDYPDLIPLKHKYMTSHCPDLIHIPQYSEMSCVWVWELTEPRQDIEISYICVLGVSSQDSQMSWICVLGVPNQDSEMSYMTSHCPDLVQISLIHKYMTSHCADFGTDTPNTQIHDISLSWFGTPNTQIHDICEMPCICVLGGSSQDSEMSCICV
jgi:hypothetical protein